jgi:type IV pilus assembly protein PilC
LGSLEAGSRDAAIGHLRGRSVFVTSLESGATVRGAWASVGIALRGSSSARPAFFRSFATLISAGIPVHEALVTLTRRNDSAFAEILSAIAADVEAGGALSRAMAAHPHDFSGVAIAIVNAGEVGGKLEEALLLLADLEERDRNLRKRLAAATAYPIVVATAAVALVLFLLANTMPAIAATFMSLHVALPTTTRVLLAIGNRLHEPAPWAALAGCSVAAMVAARRFKTSQASWAIAADRLRLTVPLLGPIVAKAMVARFARTLSALLGAGVDVVQALAAAAGVVEGPVYRNGLNAVSDALRGGDGLLASFEASGLFDPIFLQMLRAGEEGGSIDSMLLRLAQYYEVDVEAATATFTTVLEPLLICTLGAAVGTIVASIIIPLYSMIGEIQ